MPKPLDGAAPSVFLKAYGGSPPPFDQPGIVALLKSKTVVGCDGGSEGGGEGGEGGCDGGESGDGGDGLVMDGGGAGSEGGEGGEGG